MFQVKKREYLNKSNSHKKIKDIDFDFERIALFFSATNTSEVHQVISDSTLQYLDSEELFMYVDRTCSKVGQQFLYCASRTIPKTQDRSFHFEEHVENDLLTIHYKLKKRKLINNFPIEITEEAKTSAKQIAADKKPK